MGNQGVPLNMTFIAERRSGWRIGSLLLLATTALGGPAFAQTANDANVTNAQLQAEIRALRQEVETLKAERAAQPAPAPEMPAPATSPRLPDDGSLTYKGVTLYGTVDVGVMYQSHGTPISSTLSTGVEELISKNSNQHYFGLAPNELGNSKVGLKGTEDLGDWAPGWQAVFKLETSFLPTSGMLEDSVGAVARTDGVPLNRQTSQADSSRAGQAFNQEAYVGIGSKLFGTLTGGRQNSLMLDDIIAYDPLSASFAFSPVGYSGTAGGFGDTQDARLDNALKYRLSIDPVRFAALYQFSGTPGEGGQAYEFDVGADWNGFSVDANYNAKKDEILVSPLNPTPTGTNPKIVAGDLGYVDPTNPLGSGVYGTLNATISDQSAWSVLARYTLDQWKFYGAWERIIYSNPTDPIGPGYQDIGGYIISNPNNSAYTNQKMLDIYWLGTKVAVMDNLDLMGAWYHYYQHSYKGNGCSNNSSGACSGTLDAFSLVADYRLTKRFDVYGGFMYSTVADGLASGYLNTSTIDPSVGVRFNF